MDDDDLRRGRPSCHRAFDEATAILAGDALQSLAFQVLSSNRLEQLDASIRMHMLERLAQAAGSRGMAGGQAIDLAATGQQLNIAELEDMHIHKTGALLRASVLLGALWALSRPASAPGNFTKKPWKALPGSMNRPIHCAGYRHILLKEKDNYLPARAAPIARRVTLG